MPWPVEVSLDEATRRGRTPSTASRVRRLEQRRDLLQRPGHLDPRPPPPYEPLIAMGRPFSVAKATTASAVRNRNPQCPAPAARRPSERLPGLDLVSERIDRGGRRDRSRSARRRRPRWRRPRSRQEAVAGWIASAPLRRATSMICRVRVGLGRSAAPQRVRLPGSRTNNASASCPRTRQRCRARRRWPPGSRGPRSHPVGHQHLCDAHGRHSSDDSVRVSGLRAGSGPHGRRLVGEHTDHRIATRPRVVGQEIGVQVNRQINGQRRRRNG